MGLELVDTNGTVLAMTYKDGIYYVGGAFTEITGSNGSFQRTKAAAFDANGNILDWAPYFSAGTIQDFYSDTYTSSIYAIGNGLVSSDKVCFFEISTVGTGNITNPAYPWIGGANGYAIIGDQNNIYIGGSWDTPIGCVAGSHRFISKIDRTTLSPNIAFTGTVTSSDVRSLCLVGSDIYLGGQFSLTTSAGIIKTGLACMDTTSGVVNSFDARVAGLSGNSVKVTALSYDSTANNLWVGGAIKKTLDSGVIQTGICVFDGSKNFIDYNFEPLNYSYVEIRDFYQVGNVISAVGNFYSMTSGTRNGIASFQKSNLTLTEDFVMPLSGINNNFTIAKAIYDFPSKTYIIGGSLSSVLYQGVKHSGIHAILASVDPFVEPESLNSVEFDTYLTIDQSGKLNFSTGGLIYDGNVVSDNKTDLLRYPNANTFYETAKTGPI